MKIAIIGAGISGITGAWYLQQKHDVTLFEANDYLGGHTHTTNIHIEDANIPVDTGFIVFNDRTYPEFIRLLNEWGVTYAKSDMSLSVSSRKIGIEYNGGSLSGLFSQKKNCLKISFWKMLRDIIYFNRCAKKALILPDLSLLENKTIEVFLNEISVGRLFKEAYFYPMAAAIWSCNLKDVKTFPALFILKFLQNHGLLDLWNRPTWYYIQGGSAQYVNAFCKRFKGRYLLNTRVIRVARGENTVEILTQDGKIHEFDKVVFSCHADTALTLLKESSAEEKKVLSLFLYQKNEVVLHTDVSLMPEKQSAWASWNYQLDSDDNNKLASVTYFMNNLQKLPIHTPILVTLNQTQKIHPDKIIANYEYWHPLYNMNTRYAQRLLETMNGKNNSYFCGAYCGYGFHEDGVKSAINALKGLY
jgi:predicted NAD/FAD-binding protein